MVSRSICISVYQLSLIAKSSRVAPFRYQLSTKDYQQGESAKQPDDYLNQEACQ